MNPYGTIIEGIGNELLFCLSCMGTVLFLIAAWVSTRVNWDLMPVRITVLRHPHGNNNTETETRNAPEAVEHNITDSSENVLAESSGSSSEDEANSDTVVRKRSSVQTSISSTHQGNSSSSDEESKKNETREELINSTSDSNGHLVIKLQYLNDESRFVHASPTMSVSRFKKKHFVDELINQKKNVRLIFQGRELMDVLQSQANFNSNERPKRQRLCDYGITDGSTIHCLVTTPIVSSNRSSPVNNSNNTERNSGFSTSSDSMLTEFDMGTRLMKPLFAFLLLFTWFFRIVYRQYFNSVSTFALVTLTVFFCGAVFTATLVNTVSAIASLFGISRSNELSNQQQSENLTNQPDSPDVQVLTVTMVARRVPSQTTTVNQTNGTSLFSSESAQYQQIIVDEPINESQTRPD
ncbi:unnamed protein product [Schistosoma turkestanicum]|nr:unnamed protein product [Schistosoma turkestanicum]